MLIIHSYSEQLFQTTDYQWRDGMAGKRQINDSDSYDIYHYINKKFRTELGFPSEIESEGTRSLAKIDFLKIDQYPEIDRKELLKWCYTYLTGEQWQRLKTAIRRKRQRDKQKQSADGAFIGIEISPTAHKFISKLAEQYGMTLSGFLENRHGEEYFEKIVLKSQKKKVLKKRKPKEPFKISP